MKKQILPYSKQLKYYSRDLRKEMTNCEQKLWYKIRKRQLHGIQFLRQKPVGPYILDFFSRDINLAIEIDGSQHREFEQSQKDINRDKFLKTLEISTLRFTNLDVTENCDRVLLKIENFILSSLYQDDISSRRV